jgi:hypothetical protein|tara:strand:+ start:3798 stop:4652 length:855 start_codon:yes stop_codon:yes gene_type:complete
MQRQFMKDNISSALYTVDMVPLTFEDTQNDCGLFGLRREDNNDFLGSCSDRYGITQNADFIQAIDECLTTLNFGQFNRNAIIAGGGKRCFIEYDFIDDLVSVGASTKDKLGLRITALNSFDKTLLRGFRVGLWREICTNGMIGFDVDLTIEDRHTKNNTTIDKAAITRALLESKAHFTNAISSYQEMVKVDLTGKGKALFKYMVDSKVVRKRMADSVEEIWDAPTFDLDSDRNLYNFLNAWTQFLDSPHSDYREKYYDSVQDWKVKVFTCLKLVDDGFVNKLNN